MATRKLMPVIARFSEMGNLKMQAVGLDATVAVEGEGATVTFLTATLGNFEPRPGDRVTDADGVAWTVETVTPSADGVTVACGCLKVQPSVARVVGPGSPRRGEPK